MTQPGANPSPASVAEQVAEKIVYDLGMGVTWIENRNWTKSRVKYYIEDVIKQTAQAQTARVWQQVEALCIKYACSHVTEGTSQLLPCICYARFWNELRRAAGLTNAQEGKP